MPHIVWQVPVLAVCIFSAVALYFDSNVDYTTTAAWLIVGALFQVVVAAVNLVHFVALCIELADCSSTFFREGGVGYIWVLLLGSLVFTVWAVWIAWRMYVLRSDIIEAWSRGWRPWALAWGADGAEQGRGAPVVPLAPENATDPDANVAVASPVPMSQMIGDALRVVAGVRTGSVASKKHA